MKLYFIVDLAEGVGRGVNGFNYDKANRYYIVTIF
jgi:hypothetical protein